MWRRRQLIPKDVWNAAEILQRRLRLGEEDRPFSKHNTEAKLSERVNFVDWQSEATLAVRFKLLRATITSLMLICCPESRHLWAQRSLNLWGRNSSSAMGSTKAGKSMSARFLFLARLCEAIAEVLSQSPSARTCWIHCPYSVSRPTPPKLQASPACSTKSDEIAIPAFCFNSSVSRIWSSCVRASFTSSGKGMYLHFSRKWRARRISNSQHVEVIIAYPWSAESPASTWWISGDFLHANKCYKPTRFLSWLKATKEPESELPNGRIDISCQK